MRDRVRAARRIVVKVGSSSLTAPDGGTDPPRLARVVDAVAAAHRCHREVLVSSGAIAVGIRAAGDANPAPVAHLVRADALFLLSDVDALYTAHPSEPGAVRTDEVRHLDELRADTSRLSSRGGTGGMTTKLEAARVATSSGIPVRLASAEQITQALAAETGTVFHPAGRRRPARLNWLAHASQSAGELVLDEGAVQAIRRQQASLLPAGVTEVRGSFHAGDPVLLVDVSGTAVAQGIVSYDADVLPRLLGRSTGDLARELGADYQREVVHRDAMVVRR